MGGGGTSVHPSQLGALSSVLLSLLAWSFPTLLHPQLSTHWQFYPSHHSSAWGVSLGSGIREGGSGQLYWALGSEPWEASTYGRICTTSQSSVTRSDRRRGAPCWPLIYLGLAAAFSPAPSFLPLPHSVTLHSPRVLSQSLHSSAASLCTPSA